MVEPLQPSIAKVPNKQPQDPFTPSPLKRDKPSAGLGVASQNNQEQSLSTKAELQDQRNKLSRMRGKLATVVPQEHVQLAKAKISKFKAFKADFDGAMANAKDAIQVVRLKIGRHIFSEDEGKKDGVLTHKAEEYLRCLDLRHRTLEDLLIADDKHWTDNLETAKLKAQQLTLHLNNLLERQFSELSEFLSRGRLERRFELRRLPMWGQQVAASQVNFEWPSARDLDLMSPDVSLKALQFKAAMDQPAIASVLCVLSNGQNSPVFEKRGALFAHQKTKTVTFDQPNGVKRLRATTSAGQINSISFYDGRGQAVGQFEAQTGDGLEELSLQLGAQEEIFGVYGVKDEADYFTSFGFVIKSLPTSPVQSPAQSPAQLPAQELQSSPSLASPSRVIERCLEDDSSPVIALKMTEELSGDFEEESQQSLVFRDDDF